MVFMLPCNSKVSAGGLALNFQQVPAWEQGIDDWAGKDVLGVELSACSIELLCWIPVKECTPSILSPAASCSSSSLFKNRSPASCLHTSASTCVQNPATIVACPAVSTPGTCEQGALWLRPCPAGQPRSLPSAPSRRTWAPAAPPPACSIQRTCDMRRTPLNTLQCHARALHRHTLRPGMLLALWPGRLHSPSHQPHPERYSSCATRALANWHAFACRRQRGAHLSVMACRCAGSEVGRYMMMPTQLCSVSGSPLAAAGLIGALQALGMPAFSALHAVHGANAPPVTGHCDAPLAIRHVSPLCTAAAAGTAGLYYRLREQLCTARKTAEADVAAHAWPRTCCWRSSAARWAPARRRPPPPARPSARA